LLLLLDGCGENETSRDDIAPASPTPLARSGDDIYAQRGIRPEPTAIDNQYNVRIEWYPNLEPDVAGYRVWRRRDNELSHDRTVIRDLRFGVNLERGPILSWVDAGDDFTGFPANLLAPDQPDDSVSTHGFYWYLEAYDEANNRSQLSDSLYFRMINNPNSMAVIRQAPGRYALTWQYTPNPDTPYISYYMIRVYAAIGGPDSVMWYQQVNRYGGQEQVLLNNDSTARPFVRDATYVWQLNVVVSGTDSAARVPAGSATYTTFIYQD
jgi:hypothetical protein